MHPQSSTTGAAPFDTVVKGVVVAPASLKTVLAEIADLDGKALRDLVRAGCRRTIDDHRRRSGRATSNAVDGAGWSQPGPAPDLGPRGRIVEAQDLLRAEVGARIEQGRHLLTIAEGIVDRDPTRARKLLALVDEAFGDIRELRDQGLDVLMRADAGVMDLEQQVRISTLRVSVIADEYGVRVFPSRRPTSLTEVA